MTTKDELVINVNIPFGYKPRKIMNLFGLDIWDNLEEFIKKTTPELSLLKEVGIFDLIKNYFLEFTKEEYGIDLNLAHYSIVLFLVYLANCGNENFFVIRKNQPKKYKIYIMACLILAENLHGTNKIIYEYHYCYMKKENKNLIKEAYEKIILGLFNIKAVSKHFFTPAIF